MNIAVTYPVHGILTPTANAIEMLTEANGFSQLLKMKKKPFCIQLFGEKRQMKHPYGNMNFNCRIFDLAPQELILVGAVKGDPQAIFSDNQPLIKYIQYQYEIGATIVSICSGALLVAASGILENKVAATHWAYQELVKAKFPRIKFKFNEPVVDLGKIITSTGAFSSNALILYLIEKFANRRLALFTSRMYLTDFNFDKVNYYIPVDLNLDHGNSKVLEVQEHLINAYDQKIAIEQLGKKYNMSQRNLTKIFKKVILQSPSQFLQKVRIKKATELLEHTNRSVKEIMFSVGYSDSSSFRKIFKRIVGLNPSDYKEKFGGWKT